jgi:uncharacterized protein (DUF983 family)
MSRLSSILSMTCPRCRQGHMFGKMDFLHPLKMNKVCEVCGQKFEPEPGFYYGAMFISYVFIGFFSLAFVGLSVFYFHLSVEIAILALLAFLALIFLWNLRFSRSIWAHLVIKYDPKATGK